MEGIGSLPGASDYSRPSTVTEAGATAMVSLPPATLADTALGATVLGASKVLMLSTFGAERVWPEAFVAFTPASETLNVAGDFASILVTAIHILPALSLAATASTRGRMTPFVV